MTISDDQAAAEWKKAQGQVQSRGGGSMMKSLLIWSGTIFVLTVVALRFFAKWPWEHALLFAPFTAILGAGRALARDIAWKRRRGA